MTLKEYKEWLEKSNLDYVTRGAFLALVDVLTALTAKKEPAVKKEPAKKGNR